MELAQSLVRLAAVRSFACGARRLLHLSLCLLLHLSLGLLLVPQGSSIFCLGVGCLAVLGLYPVSRLGGKRDGERTGCCPSLGTVGSSSPSAGVAIGSGSGIQLAVVTVSCRRISVSRLLAVRAGRIAAKGGAAVVVWERPSPTVASPCAAATGIEWLVPSPGSSKLGRAPTSKRGRGTTGKFSARGTATTVLLGLGTLHLHHLAVDLVRAHHDLMDNRVLLESNKAKATRALRLPVEHDHCVNYATERLEVLPELRHHDGWGQASDEYLIGLRWPVGPGVCEGVEGGMGGGMVYVSVKKVINISGGLIKSWMLDYMI